MRTIYIEAEGPEAWQRFLAEPEKQWKTGFSARTLAYCWHSGPGLPRSVSDVLATSNDEALRTLEPLLAIPEHKVPLPGGGHASQTDLWLLAQDRDGLVSVAVEGKVEEPFGDLVSDWLQEREADAAKRGTKSGAGTRLDYLCQELGLGRETSMTLRYQLLHRTVAALVESRRFRAGKAVMLVHSFSPTRAWFDDFAGFVAALGQKAAGPDQLISLGSRGDVALHVGWVSGESEFLAM